MAAKPSEGEALSGDQRGERERAAQHADPPVCGPPHSQAQLPAQYSIKVMNEAAAGQGVYSCFCLSPSQGVPVLVPSRVGTASISSRKQLLKTQLPALPGA